MATVLTDNPTRIFAQLERQRFTVFNWSGLRLRAVTIDGVFSRNYSFSEKLKATLAQDLGIAA